MALRDGLTEEYEREVALTRRLIDAFAEMPLDWRPHPKSRSVGELLAHLADVPAWGARILDVTKFDIAMLPEVLASPCVHSALVEQFDRHAAAARRLLDKTDAEWLAVWCLREHGAELFSMPRTTAFRRLVLNHLIHHRGQLSVYVRMNGTRMPAMVDPADDPFPATEL